MFADLTGMIDGVSFNPLEDGNEIEGKIWLLEVLKAYRTILCGYKEKHHMKERPVKLKREEFNEWRTRKLEKLTGIRPYDERSTMINAWLIHHIKTTEIVDGTK